jgi:hypothetical protein
MLTKPSQAKPSQAKPSQAKPSQAKPSQAKPSQAKAKLVVLIIMQQYNIIQGILRFIFGFSNSFI